MAHWTCETCGTGFKRDRSGDRPVRFCGSDCYHAWQRQNPNSGQFRKGNVPWTAGKKGIRLSPATEFKPGESATRLPVGSVRVRKDKSGNPRAFVKVGHPARWRERAIVVWEAENGRLPRGMVVHHIDRDTLNDSIDNLQGMTRAEHVSEHRAELREAYRIRKEMAQPRLDLPTPEQPKQETFL